MMDAKTLHTSICDGLQKTTPERMYEIIRLLWEAYFRSQAWIELDGECGLCDGCIEYVSRRFEHDARCPAVRLLRILADE